MIANTGQVLDTPAADQHHRVLLKIVPDSRNIGGHLDPVVKRTLATLRKAELGFLGVEV
jgi:hypothetical protein